MNAIQTQELIATALENRQDRGGARFHLCYWEGKIQCCLRRHTSKPHRIFHLITPSEMREGFDAALWRRLGEEVHIYLKGLS